MLLPLLQHTSRNAVVNVVLNAVDWSSLIIPLIPYIYPNSLIPGWKNNPLSCYFRISRNTLYVSVIFMIANTWFERILPLFLIDWIVTYRIAFGRHNFKQIYSLFFWLKLRYSIYKITFDSMWGQLGAFANNVVYYIAVTIKVALTKKCLNRCPSYQKKQKRISFST